MNTKRIDDGWERFTLTDYLEAVYGHDRHCYDGLIDFEAAGDHDFWPWNSHPADTQPHAPKIDFGPLPYNPDPPAPVESTEEDPDYDDSKDHTACSDCNPNGHGRTPGWYQPFVGPPVLCDRCDGAGWV